jgi:aspartate aminotransferase
MTIADRQKAIMAKSSLIRQMFEKGAQLKAEIGAANVFDFSLGNPNLSPPAEFLKSLEHMVGNEAPGVHGYMPNAGFMETRSAVARFVAQDQQVPITAEEIVMTCGASGGLNIIFHSLLNSGEEVIVPTPCFMEYDFYAANAGGVLKKVPTRADFSLSLDDIEAALGPNTKIVLLNSPNNPTGTVYSADELTALGDMLRRAGAKYGRTLYLVSDEPYRRIIYEGVEVPSIFHHYAESIVATSFSKDLSIPGERIGYVAVNPQLAAKTDLMNALILTNRTLGFVNAPALMQRALPEALNARVDMAAYARKRDLLCRGLSACGYRFIPPAGTFYLFPQSPLVDDRAFVELLQEHHIIAVPGSAFGCPGYFRLAFCVADETITRAIPGFSAAILRRP